MGLLLIFLAALASAITNALVASSPWQSVDAFDSVFPSPPATLRSEAKPSLLYFTIAGSADFIEMFRLCLISLRPVFRRMGSSLHLLVLTRQIDLPSILSVVTEALPNSPAVHNASVQIMQARDVFEAAAAKLAIGQLQSFSLFAANNSESRQNKQQPQQPLYSKILYMDVDMLALPPQPQHQGGMWPLEWLLRSAEDGGVALRKGTLYAPGEPRYSVAHEYFSLQSYDEKQLEEFTAPEKALSDSSNLKRKQQPIRVAHPLPAAIGVDATALSITPVPGRSITYLPLERKKREAFNTGFLLFELDPEGIIPRYLSLAYEMAMGTDFQRPQFCMEQPVLNTVFHSVWFENRNRPGFDPVDWKLLESLVFTDFKNTPFDGNELLPSSTAVVHVTGLSRLPPSQATRAKLTRMRVIMLRVLRGVPTEELLL